MAHQTMILALIGVASAAPFCNMAGDWSNGRTPDSHIQFFQNEGEANFTLRTTAWGAQVSHGVVHSMTSMSVLMIGGEMTTETISNNCTKAVDQWCRYPHCPYPKPPSFPPWPAPIPPPTPARPPTWTPNWNLTESTTIQPSGDDYFAPNHTWGLISLDWSVARSIWFKNGRNKTDCEAVSTEGCRRLKTSGHASRCFIYHNMELALEWEETQRAVMYDPTKADYFLQYTDGRGNKNGTVYNEPIEFGDQYFWDYRNPEAAAYFVSSVVKSLDSPYVDGTFTDDVGGLPEEHKNAQRNTNMSDAEIADLRAATAATHTKLVAALIEAGKYNWQAFGGGDGTGGGLPAAQGTQCTAWMDTFCAPEKQQVPMMMAAGNADNSTIAAFLIVRPPIGFIGWGWESDDRKWPQNNIFNLQPGEPTGLCTTESPGVYSRAWTNGVVRLDCNEGTSELPFPSL